MKNHPPKWANRFLEWYCHSDLLEEIQGDILEVFNRRHQRSKKIADIYFVWDVLRFFRWKNMRRRNRKYDSNPMKTDMLKNYFKTGWRNLTHKKAFSFINIFGLAIGLTSFLLIGAYIYDELSFDKYASNYKNIYRVGLSLAQNGGVDEYPHVDVAVAAGIKSNFPEVAETTRMVGKLVDYVKLGDAQVKEDAILLADSNFLQVFSIALLEGNAAKALVEPNSIVVSKAFAKKYFGEKSALGEMLTLRRTGLVKITGVFDQVPVNSHFHAEAILSMTTGNNTRRRQTWSNVGFFTFVVLHEKSDAAQFEAKLPQLVEKYVAPEIQEDMGIPLADAMKSVDTWKFTLMPLENIHLYSHTKYEIEPNGDINNVYIFSALAIFILVLACINFMNLSTASAAGRAMEIGVRKALGSVRNQLFIQFLVESMLLAMLALAFALVFSFLLLPVFNQLTGKHIEFSFFLAPERLLFILGVGATVGILAGLYPAVFLSSFQTLRILKSNTGASGKRGGLRSALVVFQFAISTALIIATIIAYQQLNFMQNIKIGYDRDQVLVIENAGALRENQNVFKEKLKQDHRVVNVSNSTVPIGSAAQFPSTEVAAKDRRTSTIHIYIFSMDDDYLPTLGLELIQGRKFSNEISSDSLGTNVIINETAMKELGWTEQNVLGNTIVRSAKQQYVVVGVIKDFHYTSAKDKIAPLMIVYSPYSPAMIVKVKSAQLPDLINDVKKHWASFNIDLPFTYYFLDQKFDNLYKSEQTTKSIFIVFMVIAILIACLGLYGLSTYSAEQRIKEIGIRKVLGSSVTEIVFLQSKEFLMLVVLAIVIAAPLSWWAMQRWLENFGYRIEVNLGVVAVAGIAALIIALFTVSFQAIRAATSNPVKSLRTQ